MVGLTWTLKDTLGEVLDVLEEPVDFLIGGNDLFKKIEDAQVVEWTERFGGSE